MIALAKLAVLGIARKHSGLIGLLTIAVTGALIAFPDFFLLIPNVVIGVCLFPFVLLFDGKQRFNYVYFGMMLFFGITAWMYGVRMFYFFALAFYILLILEIHMGRINSLVLFLLVCMSPIFTQVAVLLGFPIRLMLSEWTRSLLELAGMDVKGDGNLMVLNGANFTVDEACMGLHMLAISMLMGVFLIAQQYRAQNRRLSLTRLTGFFLLVFVLNIVCNLLRIITLVVFQIQPEDPMHEIVGIFALLIYVMIPLHFAGKWWIGNFGSIASVEIEKRATLTPFGKMTFLVYGAGILGIGISVNHQKEAPRFEYADVALSNFKPVKIQKGVTKMFDDNLLVYVKPIPEFFSGEHAPMFCWKGSGYKFESIKETTINGTTIYCGKLTKETSTLYTSWWYTNGEVKTISQWDWRLRMFLGESGFCLVNVTAKDEASLMRELNVIFENDLLKIST